VSALLDASPIQIVASSDLAIQHVAIYDHHLATECFDQCSVIGALTLLSVGATQYLGTKCLRCLNCAK
jgi:nanoRNase/pAp phosphatase (c-di-AMP/oligoRNAs hydrolase)